jgi:hypothetical protein
VVVGRLQRAQEPTARLDVRVRGSTGFSDRVACERKAVMSDILWAFVMIGGPTLITAAAIYGLLVRRSLNIPATPRDDLKDKTDKPEA